MLGSPYRQRREPLAEEPTVQRRKGFSHVTHVMIHFQGCSRWKGSEMSGTALEGPKAVSTNVA